MEDDPWMNCGGVEGAKVVKRSAWPKCLSSCSLLTSIRTKSNKGDKLPFVGKGVSEKRTGPCIRVLWEGLRGGGGHSWWWAVYGNLVHKTSKGIVVIEAVSGNSPEDVGNLRSA